MSDANGNENCLEGLECPECGEHDKLLVVAHVQIELYDSGTGDIEGGVEYDDEAPTGCGSCEFQAQLKDFREAYEKKHGEVEED
jgi:hypothetical protein